MGSAEDPLATAISKLPPPIMQHKSEQPAPQMQVYADVLREMESSQVAAASPVQQQQAAVAAAVAVEPIVPQHVPQPSSPEPQPPAYHRVLEKPPPPLPPPPPRLGRSPAGSGGWRGTLSENRNLVLLAMVVAAALYIGLPRMRRMTRFAGADGQLSLAGVVALSVVIVVVYKALSYGLDMTIS